MSNYYDDHDYPLERRGAPAANGREARFEASVAAARVPALSQLDTLLATIREGLLDEIPSTARSALVMGTDEEGHRGYMLISHDELPRADVMAVKARHVSLEDGRAWWAHYSYVLDSDGYWRCTLPWRRALDRLAASNLRRAFVLWRLLMGQSPTIAWEGLREPVQPERDALAIARTVLSFAEQETSAALEHRPRDEGKCPCLRCREERKARAEERRRCIIARLERSESQLNAEAVA